jgi:methionyl-tRNA synthetase
MDNSQQNTSNHAVETAPAAQVAPVAAPVAAPAYISYDDFKKVEVKVGHILSAEKIANADKLLKLMVNFGEAAPRQIVSGISAYFPDPTTLVAKKAMFVTNLEPRTIRGHVSNGMLFAVSTEAGAFSLLEPVGDIPPGTQAK